MAEQLDLEDILSGKEPAKASLEKQPVETSGSTPAEPALTTPEKPETEAEAQARGRDATGKFVAKEEKPEKPAAAVTPVAPAVPAAPPQMSDKEKAYLAAAMDERNKRQTLQREFDVLKAAATPAEPAKSFFDDPEGTLNAFKKEMAGVIINTRLQTAEMLARSKYPDFEEKMQIFADLVQKTPGLWQQALASPNPAEFGYTTGKNHKELQDAGNIDALRVKIEKETRIKIEEELKKKQEDAIKERASIPTSLSEAHGITQNRPVWSGPSTLDDILSNK